MFKLLLVFSLIIGIVLINNGAGGESDLDKDISNQLARRNGTALSRKRRFLVFPAGSSFQLVFCLTYPSLGVGSYFVFGHTAALAWELPSTPLYYDGKDFQNKDEATETTTAAIPHDIDLNALDHSYSDHSDTEISPWSSPHQKIDTGYSGWSTNTFNRQPVSFYNNPFSNLVQNSGFNTFKKSSYGFGREEGWGRRGDWQQRGKTYNGHVRNYGGSGGLQRPNSRESYLSSQVDPLYYPVHRRSRRDLYRKIENFLTALNLDGKTCLLKAICEVTKSPKEKGTFIVEIFKAIFSVKPHENYPNEDPYDHAANSTHDCDEKYPGCQGSIWTNLFLFQKK